MLFIVHGLRERAAARPRTLVASHGKVWLWPGVALTSRRGDQIVAASGETIRFWITRLHGPDALYTEAVHFIGRAAEHLTRGDANVAQRALDRIGLDRLSSDGAALMRSVAKKLDLEGFDMPVRPGPRCLTARDIAMQVPFFEEVFDRAAPLAKFAPFDPAKHPRWPAGAPDRQGGQFTDADESGAALIPVARPPRKPPIDEDEPEFQSAPKRGIGHNSDKFPEEEPPPEERYGVVKSIGQELEEALAAGGKEWVRRLFLQLATVAWLMQQPTYYYYQLKANLDPPKTLEELQDAVGSPTLGYHIHHIVEQTPAQDEGFPEDLIESRENKVQIPEMKHRELSNWYQTRNEDYNWLSPRDYLRGKSWEERYKFGIQKLVDFGVLKP
jgi:hypothetical protein